MKIKTHNKTKNGKIIHLEVVTWTELQVRKGSLMNDAPETDQHLKNRKQLPFELKNENGHSFECDFELEGTKPANATLKLIEELSVCRTNLNEMYNEDMDVESTTLKIIRMVSKFEIIKNCLINKINPSGKLKLVDNIIILYAKFLKLKLN